MRHSAVVLSLLLLTGCGADRETDPTADATSPPTVTPTASTEDPSASPDGPPTASAASSPEATPTPSAAPEGTGVPGGAGSPTDVASTVLTAAAAAEQADVDPEGVIAGLGFNDSAGSNVVVLRRIESNSDSGAALLADHIVFPNPRERLVLREVRDGVEDCELDWVAEFVEDSLTVRDSDGNGYGEVEFAYELGCRGDVGSNELKLLLSEAGEKHILRGSTFSPFEQFEDPVPEPVVEDWPRFSFPDALTRFRTYATRNG